MLSGQIVVFRKVSIGKLRHCQRSRVEYMLMVNYLLIWTPTSKHNRLKTTSAANINDNAYQPSLPKMSSMQGGLLRCHKMTHM